MRRFGQKSLCAIFALLLVLSCAPDALAEAPEDAPEKGSAAACSTALNDSSDCDRESCAPVPVSVDTMMIGLCYEETAVEEVSLRNTEGLGFLLGYYDADRVFHPDTALSSPELVIRPGRKWHLLFNEIFETQEDAADYAERNGCTAIVLNDEHRVIYGSYQYIEEVQYLILKHGFQASPWQDDELGVYNGWGRLLALLDGKKDLALAAVSDGKAVTEFSNRSYYGGFLLHPDANGRLTVINVVDLEDYVKGVVPYEMNAAWPLEALKAQAVCARTYAVYNVNAYEEYGFDLRDDAESQVYRGTKLADETTDLAVDLTRGQFVRYHGELCEIYYYSSNGGASEDGARVFGTDRPYLAGKTDPFEYSVEFAVIKWERWRSREEITQRINEAGWPIGTVSRIEPEYSELGNVIAMRYYDETGACVRLENRDSYSLLVLDNCRFTVQAVEDGFLFSGRGWGHNCGMSQWGAYAMAANYGYSCEDIIRFYFTGATVA